MLLNIISLSFFVGTAVSRQEHSSLRVVAGRDSPPQEFPYIISIQGIQKNSTNGNILSKRLCSGSVIAPTWVLTACHCFFRKLQLRVRYGDMSILGNMTNSYRNVIEQIPHPSCTSLKIVLRKYKETMLRSDIALVLTEEIPIKTLPKLSAVEYSSFAGVSVMYAGFGSVVPYKRGVNETMPLQVGVAGVIPCGDHSHFAPAICFVPKCSERAQPNYGDSGGPLMIEGKIVGVISGCSYQYATKTHVVRAEATPVGPYLQWILHVMQNTS